jgi:alkylation response protein AidB-like acyl-CoA dehydrogenase
VLKTDIPARAELVRQAAELAPVLRANATWSDQNRRLHDDSIEALSSAGIFKMRVPTRYGGYESDSDTLLDVITQLAQGDGSTAWNVAVWSISAWLACQFPDHVQDEVFAEDVRVCGVLSPTGEATPTNGGVTVNGRWHFVSGSLHSQWQVALAMAPTPDGASMWPIMALIPMSDLVIEDDWHTTGLRGTGSVTTIADNVFVPQDRVIPLVMVLQDQSASQLNPLSAVYRSPMIATGCTSFTGTAIGLAKSAREAFLERLDRKITYTDYGSQREASITHLQLAEATLLIEEAESHALKLAALVDSKGINSEIWSLEERVRSRAYLGRVFKLAKSAAELLIDESGGSSIYTDSPIQRQVRDLHALSMHALMHSSTNAELYGRVLCGLTPNTMYL